MAKARVFPLQIRCPSGRPRRSRCRPSMRVVARERPSRAAGLPAAGDDRRRGAPLCRGVSGRCALCRQVQPGAARAARGLGRRRQAFRLRLAARDRAGAPAAAAAPRSISCTRSRRARRSTPRFASTASPISRSTAATSWKRSCRRRCRSSWSARRRCWACSCGSRWRRAAPTICRASSASRSTRRPSCCALARPHAARLGHLLPCRLAMPRSRCLCPGDGAGRRGGRAVRASRSTSSMSAAAFPVSYPDVVPPPLDDYIAAIGEAAARVRRRRAAVGRAGPGAGRGRRVGGRAGAAAARRRALRQ